MLRKYGIKTTSSGQLHLAAKATTEARLEDPKSNGSELGDAGLCGRLDESAKLPHILSRNSIRARALCRHCESIEQRMQVEFAHRIKFLEAVEVAPNRYAWKVSLQGPWVTADVDDILTTIKVQPEWANGESWYEWPDGQNLSRIIDGSWWTPQQRTALRDTCTGEVFPETDPERAGDHRRHYERITVDLYTGQEVLASA